MKRTREISLFFKRNGAYIVLALCVLAIGVSLTFAVLNNSAAAVKEEQKREEYLPTDEPTEPVTEPTDDPAEPVVKVISFIVPVEGVTRVEEYTDAPVYNSTLKRYQAHRATDYFAEEGAPVMAVYDGVILSVETTLLTGTTVTVDHGDGLITVYNSLADGERVYVGQRVTQGQVIGEVSVSNRQEADEGAHLHFQTVKNGVPADPAEYLTGENK